MGDILGVPGLAAAAVDARVDANTGAGLRGIIPRRPDSRPAVTATPTITVSATVPGTTPTHHPGSTGGAAGSFLGSINTAEFSFLGAKVGKGHVTYPGYLAARQLPRPDPLGGGYGSVTVEFFSDAPLITFFQLYTELGTFRLLVDGVEVYRSGQAIRTGTAQAGAASTITLDSGASATNGFYTTRWMRITGGTGVGQVRQVTGYVGATKVATVNSPWVTVPDATSTFEISWRQLDSNSTVAVYYPTLDWAGERRTRRYRVEVGGTQFYGVYTTAIDSIYPAPPPNGPVTVWCGDSFSAGTGTDPSPVDGLATIACAHLGWTLCNVSTGGTGVLNPADGTSGYLNAYDRLLPPNNSWLVVTTGATAGTFTITQGATTTATIAWNATIATIRSAVDTAFGAGVWLIAGSATSFFMINRSTPTSATALTVDYTSLTGGFKYVARWAGEVAPYVPFDGLARAMPFNIVLAFGHNDTVTSGFTRSALVTQATALINGIKAKYPTARIWMIGLMFLPGGSVASDGTNANADLLSAATAALPKINGTLPFIDTITVPWMSGTGKVGGQTGTGNSDVCCDTDGVHPTPIGHALYGRRIAQAIAQILGREINPT